MKPIETVFDGYRFRSRLEARWSVFFKTLDIAYEYEKEGFDLDGTWYLPDFWLPGLQRWIEIKGEEPSAQELKKVEALEEGTGYPACLFYGLPGEYAGYAYFTCAHESHGGKSFSDETQWRRCPVCEIVDVNIRHGDECLLYSEVAGVELQSSSCNCTVEMYKDILREQMPDLEKVVAHLVGRFHISGMADIGTDRKLYTPSGVPPRLASAYTAARQARFEHGEKP
ncbi:MAG: hypothetical protein ABI456_10720 [Ktedonobacteraceae bacterium]